MTKIVKLDSIDDLNEHSIRPIEELIGDFSNTKFIREIYESVYGVGLKYKSEES